MIMLLDVSASIGNKSLETAKKFLKLIVEQFGISPDPSGGKIADYTFGPLSSMNVNFYKTSHDVLHNFWLSVNNLDPDETTSNFASFDIRI